MTLDAYSNLARYVGTLAIHYPFTNMVSCLINTATYHSDSKDWKPPLHKTLLRLSASRRSGGIDAYDIPLH